MSWIISTLSCFCCLMWDCSESPLLIQTSALVSDWWTSLSNTQVTMDRGKRRWWQNSKEWSTIRRAEDSSTCTWTSTMKTETVKQSSTVLIRLVTVVCFIGIRVWNRAGRKMETGGGWVGSAWRRWRWLRERVWVMETRWGRALWNKKVGHGVGSAPCWECLEQCKEYWRWYCNDFLSAVSVPH